LKFLKQTQSIAFWIFNLPSNKVATPSQATFENIEPKAAEIAEIKVTPLIGIHEPLATSVTTKPFVQLASQTSALAAKKSKKLDQPTIKS
jgi:hypothetical protein